MKQEQIFDRIHISFDGRDYATGLFKYLHQKIKDLPKESRKYLFESKVWSIDVRYAIDLKQCIDAFWREWKINKQFKERNKNSVDMAEYNVDDFMKQFDEVER
jgi:hypothetical protein